MLRAACLLARRYTLHNALHSHNLTRNAALRFFHFSCCFAFKLLLFICLFVYCCIWFA